MRRHFSWMIFGLSVVAAASTATLHRVTDQADDQILTTLASHQYDVENEGRNFLLNEAKNSHFFLLGELHGDKEIPALLRVLWPEMWRQGYRHIGAEVSPWAAHQLESVPAGKGPEVGFFGQNKKQLMFMRSPIEMQTSSGVAIWRRNSHSFSSGN
jgi:hypothetical protein